MPAPDAPELHPALLSAMLRRDGLLTNDEIDQLVSTYAQLVAASSQRAARRLAGAGPARRPAPGSGRQRSFSEIVEELLTVFESSVVEVTRTSLRT